MKPKEVGDISEFQTKLTISDFTRERQSGSVVALLISSVGENIVSTSKKSKNNSTKLKKFFIFLLYMYIYYQKDEFPQRKYHKVNARYHQSNSDECSVHSRCINRCVQYIGGENPKLRRRKYAWDIGTIKDCPEKHERNAQ